MRNLFLLLLLLMAGMANSQDTLKQLQAIRTTLPVKIDGILTDEAWKQAPLITGLIEMRPTFGKTEDAGSKSELYLLYDDDAIYFGGIMYDHKDSISTQLVGRDAVGVNDFIGIVFDTYQDKINGMGFYVTPLNEQFDLKYSIGMNNGEDMSWNAVYTSETKVNPNNWSFEMRIPYSALRFSKEKYKTGIFIS